MVVVVQGEGEGEGWRVVRVVEEWLVEEQQQVPLSWELTVLLHLLLVGSP